MPSFRVTIAIGSLRPGTAPDSVLPTAADAAAELTVVEASDISIVAGEPRITVRFEAEAAELATQIGDAVVSAVSAVAEPRRWSVTQRVGGRWEPLGPAR
ncbi:hypothetical protein [Salinibacterium sp. ZJ454]|uniref:hypothetical protein n=1 Tax=Salinibacterium sp. ZJ454 TaxID=2708339 RepID=UPI0014229D81|nr:hypothetical protein [Salinibacterium sp. ZJ454]